MKKIYLLAIGVFCFGFAFSQSFTNTPGELPATYHSGGVVGVIDMNSDGLNDIVVMDQSVDLYVLYQQNDGSFDAYFNGTVSTEAQWGMCIGDADNDGHLDVLCGGYYDGVQLINIDAPGVYNQIELDEDYNIFMQGCNLADINNDGWLDAFACHDDGQAHIWGNDGAGNLVPHNDWIDLDISGTDDSGNYGSVWTDFDRDGDLDCFIAKCRQFISDPYDARRTNVLLVNDGNNVYTNQAAERGLVNLQQSWTSDFADLDNDGDYDCFLTTHSGTLEIYENDGSGYFTNVTAGSGLAVSGFFLQAKFADFDNDGWLDLIHSGGNHSYYRNNGDMTWTEYANTFPYTDTMHSFSIGDLNNDGWLDLYASYGDGYVDPDNSHADRLWINNGGSNHWISFDLNGTVSNRDAAGATVEIHGAFGVQIREVRDGESYGITNSAFTHFGLGSNTSVDYVLIYWPSGLTTYIENPEIDMLHTVNEVECPVLNGSISAGGSTDICPGGSVVLTANGVEGSFVWSNGSTTNSIEVTEAGSYSIIMFDGDGCSTQSNIIPVSLVLPGDASISVSGATEFCEGNTVQLIASNGAEFLWSTGSDLQAITVDQAGDYSVMVTDACGTEMESAPVVITVYDAPDAPAVTDVVLDIPGSATFTTTGDDIRWYDSVDGVVPVGTGTSYTTPWLEYTTSFWVEDVMTHGGDLGNGGKMATTTDEAGQYHNNSSNWLIFDALQDIFIVDVKVFANGAGTRTIQLVDELGAVQAETDVDVPDGESVVALNFFVAEGVNYGLRCSTSNPQLWRDKNIDVDFPYEFPYDIGGLATITRTTADGGGADSDNYYYFFYDWHVQTPEFECPSPRTEATVTITGFEELEVAGNISIYPNPASDVLQISFDLLVQSDLSVRVLDAVGKVVATSSFAGSHVGNNQHALDISGLAAGVYQLEITANGHSAFRQVVVE